MVVLRLGKRNSPRAQDLRSPLARADELIVEEVGDEVLIYDQRTHDAHCLSAAAGQVWRACDGKTPREQLSAQLGLDAGTVERALEELETCALLEGDPHPGVTRRQATKRFVQAGAAAAAAPLIYSIVSPVPAAAQSFTACFRLSGNCGTTGCLSVVGCCCCHQSTLPACATDPQHCCIPASMCTPPAHCSTDTTITSQPLTPGTSGALSKRRIRLGPTHHHHHS